VKTEVVEAFARFDTLCAGNKGAYKKGTCRQLAVKER